MLSQEMTDEIWWRSVRGMGVDSPNMYVCVLFVVFFFFRKSPEKAEIIPG